jgi:hypothetical protein
VCVCVCERERERENSTLPPQESSSSWCMWTALSASGALAVCVCERERELNAATTGELVQLVHVDGAEYLRCARCV